MSENRTILVIDDSSTIRRLVDRTLSREGYNVILAPTAEEGLILATEHHPHMILLDHQLPGTTGFEVCQHLTADPELMRIPVVISSTLRKKAYVEYAELANVVDMLPKPYTEDLLVTSVANALDTGSLVVDSQSQGTAVPEVINEQGESDLTGTLNGFTIREVLDFLNNGKKQGVLEVEGAQKRFSICLQNGRVVGVSATGIPADEVIDRLPDSLSELAPVVNVTMGRGGSALDSIVDLLNTEVLDPRLLRKLLRHQSAVLLMGCFGETLTSFRFDQQKTFPPLFKRIPLDISVLALLVEGATTRSPREIPTVSEAAKFTRQPIRGQNLDRAGLSAGQSLILGQLATPKTLSDLVAATEGDAKEVRSVLYGLELAELIACEDIAESSIREIVMYESDLTLANKINKAFVASESYKLTVVSDITAARLLARRSAPEVIVVDATNAETLRELQAGIPDKHIQWLATTADGAALPEAEATIARPFTATSLLDALDALTTNESAVGMPEATNSESNLCTTS